MTLDEIIINLKKNKSNISQQNYAKIIDALKGLGYTGKPETWHETKRPVREVLPEKIQWFIDTATSVNVDAIVNALAKGGVSV
jgi:hypothetical protein